LASMINVGEFGQWDGTRIFLLWQLNSAVV